jgi:TRAP-type C4-dicarboxylate transport system substrate-binding protein
MLPKHPSAAPGTFDAVRDGLVDLSFVTASYTPARHILPLMAELPGAGETALINSVAYSRIYWKYFDKVGEYKGVKQLGVFTHGPGQMFTKRPVSGINDIQGLKIRTGGGIAEAVAKALGTSAFVKPAVTSPAVALAVHQDAGATASTSPRPRRGAPSPRPGRPV